VVKSGIACVGVACNELTFDVNDATYGTPGNPGFYKINGGAITSTPGVVRANDIIELFNTSQQHDATFTVPNELAVVGSKLAATADAGEYQNGHSFEVIGVV